MTKQEIHKKIIDTATHCEEANKSIAYITAREFCEINDYPYMPSHPEPPKFNSGGGGSGEGLFSSSYQRDTYVYDFDDPHYRSKVENYHKRRAEILDHYLNSMETGIMHVYGPFGLIEVRIDEREID